MKFTIELTDYKRDEPLDKNELVILGTYNAEAGRGIRHEPDWEAIIYKLQERFNKFAPYDS